MANYVGKASSNYFLVKDQDAFRKALSGVSIDIEPDDKDPALLCLMSDDEGGWPSSYIDEEGECRDFDVFDLLRAHLAEGQVAILIDVGAERLRYLAGSALAIHSDGRVLRVDLTDIYEKVKSEFHVEPTLAEY